MMELPASLQTEVFVKRGSVLLSDIFKSVGHPKFFVIVGMDEDCVVGFFYVNSDINRFVNRKDEQLKMQYPLFKRDYSFLSYDSFICATNITKIPLRALEESIASGRTRYKASLKKEHMDALLAKVRESRLFSKKEKEKYFY